MLNQIKRLSAIVNKLSGITEIGLSIFLDFGYNSAIIDISSYRKITFTIFMQGKYKVITLCGSTRFKDEFLRVQKELTLKGYIVISVGLFGHSGDNEVLVDGVKEMLDDMHLAKIDMADEIFIVNPGGYIGKSTAREIAYARSQGKAVRSLCPLTDDAEEKTDGHQRRVTPAMITALKDGEVFVFGSNKEGLHCGGAARTAFERFGAKWGEGIGMTGRCYAIPTMDGSLDIIRRHVDDFTEYARTHPGLTFLVTPIGCGIAGWRVDEIAPLFKEASQLENVTLPKSFWTVLDS